MEIIESIIATAHEVSAETGNYNPLINSFMYKLPLKDIDADLLAYFEYKVATQKAAFTEITDEHVIFGVPDVATQQCRVTPTVSRNGRLYPKFSAIQVATTLAQRLEIAAANKAAKQVTATVKKQAVDMSTIKL
jgi:hypothetical protein